MKKLFLILALLLSPSLGLSQTNTGGGGTGVGGGGVQSPSGTNAQTVSPYTIAKTDSNKLITFNSAGAFAVTLPNANTFTKGTTFWVENLGVGTVTITPTVSTINLNASQTLTTGQGGILVSDGTNYAFVSGLGASFANPTGTVGLTAVNGVATTAMRSDAAPALAAQTANTAIANVTNGSAVPTYAALPSCVDSAGNHLNYTLGTGFSCGTSTTGSVSFPLAAPIGSATTPSYGFTGSGSDGSGMSYQAGSGVIFEAVDTAASGFLFTLKSPADSTLEFQIGCTYSSLGCATTFVPTLVTAAGVSKRWHFTASVSSNLWQNQMTLQHEAANPSTAIVIPDVSASLPSIIFPCTGNTAGSGSGALQSTDCKANDGPVAFLDGGGVVGTDGMTVGTKQGSTTFGSVGVNNIGKLFTNKTGTNNGGILLNGLLYVNNSSNNNGTLGGVDIAVASAGSGPTGLVIRTNDAACLSGTGCIQINPHASSGRPLISADDANGLDFVQQNATGTTQNSFRMDSSNGISLGSGGFGTFQWRINTSGHLVAVTDNQNDIGASGATRPRNLWIAGTSNVPGLATFGAGQLFTESTAPTNVASSGVIWEDSTAHEFEAKTNGASSVGMLVRAQPGAIHQTAQTAAISTATLCASSAGACNTAGQYHVQWYFTETGTACGTPGTGGVTFLLTWTDGDGNVHSAVSLGMDDASALNVVSQTFHFQTSKASAFGSGDFNIATNGSIIQYATGYTACSVGTGQYTLDIAVTRVQ